MTTQAITPSKATKQRKPWWKRYLLANEAVLLGILVLALIAFLMIVVPTARQPRTYFDLLREISPNLIAAIGVTLLMLAAEFDLSIGAMLAVTGVVTVSVFNLSGNMWLGILAAATAR
jgi:ribose transport system permease protein